MEKLNCKSLMIGDWVFDNAASDKPVRIEQINEKNVHYKRGNGYISSGVELLEPVPLTTEILEKNGFVFLTDLWYLTTKERKPIHVVFKDNNVITLSINATPVPIGLKYVHQLQHALRLYEIEKEIVL